MSEDFLTVIQQLRRGENLQELLIELMLEFERPWPNDRLPGNLLEISQEIVRTVKERRWTTDDLSSAVFALGKAAQQRNGPSMVELAAEIANHIHDPAYAYQLLIAVENELSIFSGRHHHSAAQLQGELRRRPGIWSDCSDLFRRVNEKLSVIAAD